MAKIDDLVTQVNDARLRRELEAAVAELKRKTRFGLVYENHLPEMTALPGVPVDVGSLVVRREKLSAKYAFRVTEIAGAVATLEPVGGKGEATKQSAPVAELIPLQRFGEPIYPGLEKVGSVERGGAQRPHHAVINAENYHAVQLLLHLYEGQVDCLYLDPPYNTGARDWTYNNDYVDSNDSFRHSKWLSFMEKRLRLAKRLLKEGVGVLVVTIDEHEVHTLGVLLAQVFPDYLRYMVSIIINPKGTAKANFSRVDEQAFFIVPNQGKSDVINARPVGETQVEISVDDDEEETIEDDDEDSQTEIPQHGKSEFEYQHARRRGTESSYRQQRPNQFYPIFINEEDRTVVRIGESIPSNESPNFEKVDGLRPIWPIDLEGNHRCWRFAPKSMENELSLGNLFVGKHNRQHDSWTLNIRRPRKQTKKLKTVWAETSHDAGTHGTGVLRKLLGAPGFFAFPKSVYAVRDCLAAVVRNRPDALIVDFFAGSGTTFHATCLLNAEDGGQRRCILVTNNEVDPEQTRTLHGHGHYKGDPEFEANGIFERVTRPRCHAVVTGKRADGTLVPGTHIGGRPLADGFEENVSFFRLNYLDPDRVDMGHQFAAIAPLLWLEAGGIGAWQQDAAGSDEPGYALPPGTPYAILFKESRFGPFLQALSARPDVTHVFLVTDSEEAYAEMRAALPSRIKARMLYRDYLRSFRIGGTAGTEGGA